MKVMIKFSDPLRDLDTEKQTYGCRQNNPEICKKNGLTGVCAFTRIDGICTSPSLAWARQYRKLALKKGKHEKDS